MAVIEAALGKARCYVQVAQIVQMEPEGSTLAQSRWEVHSMAKADISKTLHRALRALETEKATLDRQIGSIEAALDAFRRSGSPNGRVSSARTEPKARKRSTSRGRPRMSAAARQAVSKRMKAYWAQRRARAGVAAKRKRAT